MQGPEEQLKRRLKLGMYDRGLNVGHTLFMKEQDGSVKSLARILKLWTKTLCVPGMADFKKGFSFRIELIAVAAAQGADNDMLLGLERAWEMMVDFRDMKILFTRFYNKPDIPATVGTRGRRRCRSARAGRCATSQSTPTTRCGPGASRRALFDEPGRSFSQSLESTK